MVQFNLGNNKLVKVYYIRVYDIFDLGYDELVKIEYTGIWYIRPR